MADIQRVITLDVKASQQALANVKAMADSMKNVEDRVTGAQSALGNFARYGIGALAGYLTVGTITSGLFNIAKALDDIGDAAERANLSAGQMGFLQELAKLNELDDIGTLERGLRNFNLSLADSYDEGSKAAQMLKAMRVELVEGDTAGNLQKFAQGYEQIQNSALRAAVQQEFFGKTGNELHKFIIAIANEQENLNKHISEYEQRMGPAIVAAGIFDDNLKQLKKSAFDFGSAVAGPVIEALNGFIKKANSGEFGKAIDAIHNALLSTGLFEETDMSAASHGRLRTGKIKRPGDEQSPESTDMEKRLRAIFAGKDKPTRAVKATKQDKVESVSDWSPLSLRWESDFPWMQAGEDATGPAEEIHRIQDALDHLTGQDKVKELSANLQLLQDAFEHGIIPVEQYDEAIQRLFADTVPDNVKKTEEAMRSVSTAITDAAADMVEAFTDTDKSIGESMQSILRSFLKTIARIQIESMLAPLNKAIPGFLGSIASGIFGGSTGGGAATGDMHFDDWGVGSALGNVFTPNGIMRFATGGVVSRPTMFAYGGGLGVMGEAGPEAVMPLKRGRDGKLGVDGGASSSSVVINISNTSSGAKVGNVQERRRGDGTREIAIAVEDIMDAALARGRYDSVLGAKYGVSPMGRR